jgi:hypothetical protein
VVLPETSGYSSPAPPGYGATEQVACHVGRVHDTSDACLAMPTPPRQITRWGRRSVGGREAWRGRPRGTPAPARARAIPTFLFNLLANEECVPRD